MLDNLTPHAFDARLAQLTGKGFAEYEFDEWTAFFEVDEDPYGGMDEQHRVCACVRCKLVGAWREDEDGNLFAGNREEILAVVGPREVRRWEAYAEEMEE